MLRRRCKAVCSPRSGGAAAGRHSAPAWAATTACSKLCGCRARCAAALGAIPLLRVVHHREGADATLRKAAATLGVQPAARQGGQGRRCYCSSAIAAARQEQHHQSIAPARFSSAQIQAFLLPRAVAASSKAGPVETHRHPPCWLCLGRLKHHAPLVAAQCASPKESTLQQAGGAGGVHPPQRLRPGRLQHSIDRRPRRAAQLGRFQHAARSGHKILLPAGQVGAPGSGLLGRHARQVACRGQGGGGRGARAWLEISSACKASACTAATSKNAHGRAGCVSRSMPPLLPPCAAHPG